MAQPVLLYTSAEIWLVNKLKRTADSRASITAAQTENLGVYVSPMTGGKVATLVAKNRLQLALSPEAWFDALLGLVGVRLAPMPPRVLIASTTLPGGATQGSGGSHHRSDGPHIRLFRSHP